ncbi:MAG: DUF456 domain-containing protein [Gemmatimonadota bacterium]
MLFAVVLLGCLFVVPLGLPGLWMMIGAAFLWNWIVPTATIGWGALGLSVAMAVLAEVFEWTLSAKYTARYGGSRRAGWGAILGGIAGAFIGVPIPIIGSVIGAFAGAFAGALIMEFSRRESTAESATRVAKGALVGRVAATAVKVGLGCAVAALLLIATF